jgi:predicted acylesterase/phospholipase RssA
MTSEMPLPATAATPGAGGPAASGARHHRAHVAKPAPVQQPAAAARPPRLPARVAYTAAEAAAAEIPGMPDARFWADSVSDFTNALPSKPGPWLALSSGGSDGAFGAGLLNGLTASGKRPDYSVVTGVSTGALIAPFAFAGPHYDDKLRDLFTKITAADIFEAGSTGESFVDTWPLKDLIAKEITPELLATIATAHKSGRRLFIVTTDLDAERSVVWNMGAIAAHGGNDALTLFRTVLLASSAIPGGFPPVLIDVESNGKHFQEMHVDGGVGGQFFVAPAALMASSSDYRLPATALYVVVDSGLQPEFAVVDRSTPSIVAQAVGAAVKVDTRLLLDRTSIVAKRSNVGFNVATIPPDFNAPSRGPFDPDYMTALFQAGRDLGQSATPFGNAPPPYPGRPDVAPSGSDKAGASR